MIDLIFKLALFSLAIFLKYHGQLHILMMVYCDIYIHINQWKEEDTKFPIIVAICCTECKKVPIYEPV